MVAIFLIESESKQQTAKIAARQFGALCEHKIIQNKDFFAASKGVGS